MACVSPLQTESQQSNRYKPDTVIWSIYILGRDECLGLHWMTATPNSKRTHRYHPVFSMHTPESRLFMIIFIQSSVLDNFEGLVNRAPHMRALQWGNQGQRTCPHARSKPNHTSAVEMLQWSQAAFIKTTGITQKIINWSYLGWTRWMIWIDWRRRIAEWSLSRITMPRHEKWWIRRIIQTKILKLQSTNIHKLENLAGMTIELAYQGNWGTASR